MGKDKKKKGGKPKAETDQTVEVESKSAEENPTNQEKVQQPTSQQTDQPPVQSAAQQIQGGNKDIKEDRKQQTPTESNQTENLQTQVSNEIVISETAQEKTDQPILTEANDQPVQTQNSEEQSPEQVAKQKHEASDQKNIDQVPEQEPIGKTDCSQPENQSSEVVQSMESEVKETIFSDPVEVQEKLRQEEPAKLLSQEPNEQKEGSDKEEINSSKGDQEDEGQQNKTDLEIQKQQPKKGEEDIKNDDSPKDVNSSQPKKSEEQLQGPKNAETEVQPVQAEPISKLIQVKTEQVKIEDVKEIQISPVEIPVQMPVTIRVQIASEIPVQIQAEGSMEFNVLTSINESEGPEELVADKDMEIANQIEPVVNLDHPLNVGESLEPEVLVPDSFKEIYGAEKDAVVQPEIIQQESSKLESSPKDEETEGKQAFVSPEIPKNEETEGKQAFVSPEIPNLTSFGSIKSVGGSKPWQTKKKVTLKTVEFAVEPKIQEPVVPAKPTAEEEERRRERIEQIKVKEREVREEMEKAKKVKREMDEDTPFIKKIGISVVASLVLTGICWVGTKNSKYTALATVISFAGSFVVQK